METPSHSRTVQPQTSRKRSYASGYYGIGIVKLPSNLKLDPKYMSQQNLSTVGGGAVYWDSSYSEADSDVTSRKNRRRFGKEFVKSHETIMKEIEDYQMKYRHLLHVPDDQICLRQDGSLNYQQTALNCLSMSPIFGRWNLELWSNFQVECIDKGERDVARFRFLPAITGKSAFGFAAYNGLDKVCLILWQILRSEDHMSISKSTDPLINHIYWSTGLEEYPLRDSDDYHLTGSEIILQVPDEFQQASPPKRSRRSIDLENDFENMLEFVGDAGVLIHGSSDPVRHTFATVQNNKQCVALISIP